MTPLLFLAFPLLFLSIFGEDHGGGRHANRKGRGGGEKQSRKIRKKNFDGSRKFGRGGGGGGNNPMAKHFLLKLFESPLLHLCILFDSRMGEKGGGGDRKPAIKSQAEFWLKGTANSFSSLGDSDSNSKKDPPNSFVSSTQQQNITNNPTQPNQSIIKSTAIHPPTHFRPLFFVYPPLEISQLFKLITIHNGSRRTRSFNLICLFNIC